MIEKQELERVRPAIVRDLFEPVTVLKFEEARGLYEHPSGLGQMVLNHRDKMIDAYENWAVALRNYTLGVALTFRYLHSIFDELAIEVEDIRAVNLFLDNLIYEEDEEDLNQVWDTIFEREPWLAKEIEMMGDDVFDILDDSFLIGVLHILIPYLTSVYGNTNWLPK